MASSRRPISRSSASPAWCPRVSFTPLNPSRSHISTAISPPAFVIGPQPSATARSKPRRLGKPVRGSSVAMRRSASTCARCSVTSRIVAIPTHFPASARIEFTRRSRYRRPAAPCSMVASTCPGRLDTVAAIRSSA